MLYNPDWKDPTIYSLESLVGWLEKQPADKKYDFCQPEECVIAQYLKSQGIPNYMLNLAELHNLGWRDIASPANLARGYPEWTFGAALARARAAQG